MGNWQSLDLNKMIPSALTQAPAQVSSLVQQFLQLARAAIATAKVYEANLSSGDGTDLLTVAVQAVVDVIETFLNTGKIHILFVPMPRLDSSNLGATVPPTLADVGYSLGFNFEEAGIAFSSNAQTAYSELVGERGGNRGFYNAVLASLMDEFDVNRPQYFAPTDAVAMSVVLAGAQSFSQLVDVAAAFNRLFKPASNGDLTAALVPTPQNLRARVIGVPNASSIGVRLDWDPPQTNIASPFMPGVFMNVKRYAVIRSLSPKTQGATSVLDLFPSRSLTVGMTSTDQKQSHKVIAIGSGANTSYVDAEQLDPTQSYFYSVAWEIEVSEQSQTSTVAFDRLSNVVKTRVRVPMPTQNSVPPDWTSTPTVIDVFPDLAQNVQLMLAQLQRLTDRTPGGSSSLGAGLDMLEANIEKTLNQIDELNQRAQQLNAALAVPLPSLYSTTMVGVGGNTFLVGELAARLQDMSDSGRPPFDDNEYVIGVCIVAGGARLPDIQPIVDFLQTFFGPPSPSNPLLNALNQVDGAVSAAEQPVFGPNMQPLPLNPDGTVTQPDGSTAAIDPLTGRPALPATPVIADNGTPVATNNPKNPNTGVTNKIDPKDLC